MLVVSIVAWLALLLAEAGQFRLVPILLIVWWGGLILLVFIRSVLAAAGGILLCALAHALGPPQLALLVAPIFAILSLIGLWCVARRLGGVTVAWITVALTAVSLPQIWFAKLSLPETVAQGFVMAGVLAWLVASSTRTTGWAMAAGWFFGLACFAKVDLLILMPVVLLAMVAARLLTRARRDDPPILLALCVRSECVRPRRATTRPAAGRRASWCGATHG